jgi:tetratricopeptide (TPR) repeat protein
LNLPSRIGVFLAAFGLGWLGHVSGAEAAPSGLAGRLDGITLSARMVETRLVKLEKEYGHRRGLIGAQAAEARFREAVFAYLVEDYDRAATVFYTLVEAEALVEKSLAQDAEWFLAECLFEEGNFGTSVEAYERIVRQGKQHPFFNDAVRKQLEAYGRLKDTPSFYRVYNRFIVTGVVPTTDAVKYSVAKSFYHQGDNARAKALFAGVPTTSAYYTRARYFTGAILITEKQLEAAIKQFEAVDSHMPPDTAQDYHGYGGIRAFAQMRAVETEVHELARLALGRLHYEQGRYDRAQAYYQDIRSESTYFTEQMYELVWTYVKQEKWLEAINQIEICLIADPDQLHSFQLRLLLGHLNMRRKDHNRALASYENVVQIYGPVRDHLQSLERDQSEPKAFFEALVKARDPGMVDPKLPSFAVDLLVNDDQMGRAVEARRALDRQKTDLDYAQDLIALVSPALRSGKESIGTFRQGRAAIAAVQGDDLKLRADLTDFELSWMESHASGGTSSRLVPLRERWRVLVGRTGQVRSIETDATERQSAHETQVREVQHKAFQVQQIALDQQAQITAIRRRLRENASGLSPADVSKLRAALDKAQSGLRDQLNDLERAQGETVRRRVMSTVRGGTKVDTLAQRGLIGEDLTKLHRDLVAMRAEARAPASVYPKVDELWGRSESFARRSQQTLDKLEKAEQTELSAMRQRLSTEMDGMTGIGADLRGASIEMDTLASGITRRGIGRVEDAFDETVMGADRGIVDVYWVKKGNIASEQTRLNAEKNKRIRALNERFLIIDSRLDQSGIESSGGGQ